MPDWPLLTHTHAGAGTGGELSLYGKLADAETVAALWTFNAGLKLPAGESIYGSDSNPYVTIDPTEVLRKIYLTGFTRIDDELGINQNPSGYGPFAVNLTTAYVNQTSIFRALAISVSIPTPNPVFRVFQGGPSIAFPASAANCQMFAFDMTPTVSSGGAGVAMTNISLFRGAVSIAGFGSPTVTIVRGAHLVAPLISFTPAITDAIGVDIENQGNIYTANACGLRILNQTNATSTNRLIEALGATGTNLRLEAGDPSNPGAGKGRSQALLMFNENGSLNARRVEHVDDATLGGGGTKVLIAV